MNTKSKHISLFVLVVLLAIMPIIICNIWVISDSHKKCYTDVDKIPCTTIGILLGTGRSSEPSPYYDARVQAAAELWEAGKIKMLIISGENLYEDYNEVDSMATAIEEKTLHQLPIALDYGGTDTYASLINAAWRFGSDNSYVIISQHFHNQRAVFLADNFLSPNTIAFDAKDTSNIYWRTRNFFREFLARTKAVLVRCLRNSMRTQPESIMDIVHNSVYGETHAYCLWHNRYWEVFGEEGKYVFSAMTTRCPDMSLFDSLVSDITNEMGNPVKAHLYVPMMEDWPENHPDFGFAEWHNDSVRITLHYNSLDEYTAVEIASLDDSLNIIGHWFDDSKSLYHFTLENDLKHDES